MSVNGELYCDGCFLAIAKQKYATCKKAGKNGVASSQDAHYHNRGYDDCWVKHKRMLEQDSLGSVQQRRAA